MRSVMQVDKRHKSLGRNTFTTKFSTFLERTVYPEVLKFSLVLNVKITNIF